MWIAIRGLTLIIAKPIGAFALGSVILWHVAMHCGSRKGTAYVYVPAIDVTVMVDNVEYHRETVWESPIVYELRPGRHNLRMFRDGQVRFEENFTLSVGEHLILTPYEPPAAMPADAARPSVSTDKPPLPLWTARANSRAAESLQEARAFSR